MALSLAAATLGSSLLGGIFSATSAKRQNRMAAQQAQIQRDFQERMSSTAHQRGVKDLRAAGLNPILSALGSGSSSPSGAQAPVVGELEGAATSARALAREIAEIQNIKKTGKLIDANVDFTKNKSAVISPAAGLGTDAAALYQRIKSFFDQSRGAVINSGRTLQQEAEKMKREIDEIAKQKKVPNLKFTPQNRPRS